MKPARLYCVAKRDRACAPPTQVMQQLQRTSRLLARRLDDVETIAREHRRILEVQFKRIAAMQAELDVLLAERRRAG
jgi:hypothetical protein